MGNLHDPVTWYGINYTETQITQWDFRSKGKSGWTGTSSFVLEVPPRNLRPSVIYSVPCDRIVQRAYYNQHTVDLENETMLELYVFPRYNMRDLYQVSVSVKRRLQTESFS